MTLLTGGSSSFVSKMKARAEATPDDLLAVDDSGRRISFGDYFDQVESVAAGLADMGIGAGDVVSWQLPNSVDTLVLIGAISRLGATQNPMVPIYREQEIGFIARQVGAKLLVVPKEHRGVDYEELAARALVGSGASVLTLDGQLPMGDPNSLPSIAEVEPKGEGGDAVRWLYYSSGSTAEPKGARHTDATLSAAANAMRERFRLTPADRFATVAPLSHIGGGTWLVSAVEIGHRLICIAAFDSSSPEILSREGMTIGGASAVFHQAYLAAQRAHGEERLFPELRLCVGGGASKPPALHGEIRDEVGGVGIVYGYGLTECPTLSLNDIGDSDENLATTEGRPSPGMEVRIQSPTGEVLGAEQEGEIVVRGAMLCHGYVDPTLDADAFTEDGWFRTGDLGKLSPAGHVIITGRLKEIVIRKGENISTKEVEDVLYRHPAVAEVAVFGLPDPDLGERCCAAVILAAGATDLSLDEIRSFMLGEGLMIQKVPEQLEIVEEFPVAPAGKVLKSKLRERFLEQEVSQ